MYPNYYQVLTMKTHDNNYEIKYNNKEKVLLAITTTIYFIYVLSSLALFVYIAFLTAITQNAFIMLGFIAIYIALYAILSSFNNAILKFITKITGTEGMVAKKHAIASANSANNNVRSDNTDGNFNINNNDNCYKGGGDCSHGGDMS